MKSALFLWFLTATLAAQTASVEGTVVNKTTGEPVAGAHIRLIDSSGIQDQSFGLVYGAISDRAGHYSIADMKPGGYFVTVQHVGFIDPFRSGSMPPMLAVKAGEHLTDHKLEMVLAAHLSGHVMDEQGDPAFGFIQVKKATANEEYSGNGNTDDRGEFRIAVAPGRYYLQAQPQQYGGSNTEIRNGVVVGGHKTTYYPSSLTRDGASVVEVAAGQEVTGLDIRYTRESGLPGHLLTISGVVTGFPEHNTPMVMVTSGDSPSTMWNSRGSSTNADGTFTVSGLEPKYYRLKAQTTSGKMQSQAVEFHLTADQSNVQLVLLPAEELSGTIEFTGGTLPPGKKPTIYLDPNDPFGSSGTAAELAADGTFRVAGMFPGKYKLRVEALPENGYVKSVVLDGSAVEPQALDLSRGIRTARLKIGIGLNGAQVSGKVLGHDGQPVVSPMVMLLVWKDPKSDDPNMQQRITNNEFKVSALPPGKIRILAVDAMDFVNMRDLPQDEMKKALVAAAEEIEVKEGEHLVKDLKVLDKEKLNAGAK